MNIPWSNIPWLYLRRTRYESFQSDNEFTKNCSEHCKHGSDFDEIYKNDCSIDIKHLDTKILFIILKDDVQEY